MKVWEIMSRPVITIPPSLPIKHVAAILSRSGSAAPPWSTRSTV